MRSVTGGVRPRLSISNRSRPASPPTAASVADNTMRIHKFAVGQMIGLQAFGAIRGGG